MARTSSLHSPSRTNNTVRSYSYFKIEIIPPLSLFLFFSLSSLFAFFTLQISRLEYSRFILKNGYEPEEKERKNIEKFCENFKNFFKRNADQMHKIRRFPSPLSCLWSGSWNEMIFPKRIARLQKTVSIGTLKSGTRVSWSAGRFEPSRYPSACVSGWNRSLRTCIHLGRKTWATARFDRLFFFGKLVIVGSNKRT